MKRFLTFLLLTMLNCSAFSQIHITACDGHLEFDIPDNELVTTDFYDFQRVNVWIQEFTTDNTDNIRLLSYFASPILFDVIKNDDFMIKKDHIVEMIKNNDINESGTYSINSNFYYVAPGKKRYESTYLDETYHKVYYSGEPIGEWFITTEGVDYKINSEPVSKSVKIFTAFVLNDFIISIDLNLNHSDLPLVPEIYPELFTVKEDGNIYWKSRECILCFCDILMGDDYVNLPPKLRALRETFDMIMNTLVINE